jgi:hypothetical protein
LKSLRVFLVVVVAVAVAAVVSVVRAAAEERREARKAVWKIILCFGLSFSRASCDTHAKAPQTHAYLEEMRDLVRTRTEFVAETEDDEKRDVPGPERW